MRATQGLRERVAKDIVLQELRARRSWDQLLEIAEGKDYLLGVALPLQDVPHQVLSEYNLHFKLQ